MPLNQGWFCNICNKPVAAILEPGNDHLTPISRYWKGTLEEVYCSPECSLKGHIKED